MDERTSPTAKPGKDWASCLPCHSNSTTWLHDSVRFINNYPISFGQKSWCNLWWPADLQRAHCKDCSILQICTTQHQKDQALSDRASCKTSCPGPCHFQAGLLQCSSGWTSIKHNQNSTNDFEYSGTSSTSPKEPMLHLSLSPCTGYQLQPVSSSRHIDIAYRTTTGSAPTYFHSLLQIYIPFRSLRSASERRLVVPSQRGKKSLSRTFSFTTPGWWNYLPTPSGMLDPSQSSNNNWKLISFNTTWLHHKKKILSLFQNLYLSLHPLLAYTYLNNAWDLVLWTLPLYVCLFKMNRFMYSPIVSCFG